MFGSITCFLVRDRNILILEFVNLLLFSILILFLLSNEVGNGLVEDRLNKVNDTIEFKLGDARDCN